MPPTDIADRLRRPEYTGENRCLPCTVVNVAVAAVGAAAVGAVGRPAYGVAAFAAGAFVVYVRGYLLPGTPALTRRYFPPRLLRAFGKDPVDATADARNGEADASTTGVVRRDGDGIALTPEFREAWLERTRRVRERGVAADDVEPLFDAEDASRVGDGAFVVDGEASVRWASAAALAADVAAGPLLGDRLDGWSTFDRERRRSVLTGLRLLLDRCPACDGAVTVTERTVDPCCQRAHRVAEAVCDDCGAVVADAAVVATGGDESVAGRHLGSGGDADGAAAAPNR